MNWSGDLAVSLMFGLACGLVAVAAWRWDRRNLVGRYEKRRLAAEAESDRLRLRISALRAGERRAAELAEELSRSRIVAGRVPDLEAEVARQRSKAERVDEMERDLERLTDRAEEADDLELRVSTLTVQLERVGALRGELDKIRTEAEVAGRLRDRLGELESELEVARSRADRLRDTEDLLARARLEIAQLAGRLDTYLDRRRRTARELHTVSTMAAKAEKAAAAADARAAAAEALVIRRDETILALQKRLARLDGAPSRPAATNGRRDDLQAIVGIGPVLERKLNELGIVSWEQVAALDEAGVARVSAHLPGVPGRIERDRWVAQAADLVERFLDGRPDDAPLAVARSPLEGSRSAKGPR